MPVSAISLLNNIGLASPKIQKIIPNYSILFWHHTEKWNDVNSSTSYGNDPSNYNDPLRIFRQYDIGQSSIPDVAGFYSNSKSTLSFNYLVRCVSSNTAWPSICDIKYDANTNMKTTQTTLLDIGGAHNYTLVGRTSPPLKNDIGTALIPNIPVSYYNTAHAGHLHQVEGLYNSITSVNPGATDCILLNDLGFHVPKSFSSFFVDPIIKDPRLLNIPVTAIPKDIVVMYYGDSTLSLDHYDPYDMSKSGDNNNIDYSALGFALPLTFVQTSTYLEAGKVGAKNLIIAAADVNSLLTESRILAGLQSKVTFVGFNTSNTITFVTSSNTSGWHDHAPLAKQSSRLISSNPAVTYNVITKPNGGTVYPNNVGEKYPDGPDPINHKHNVTYTSELKLKSVKLKAFLSKTSDAPITKGLIIGYSIGKYSKYSGNSKDGSNSLPPGWYFCDGQNGTPDLRGTYPFLDFTFQGTNDGSTINPTKSSILIKKINVETINWQHGHVSGTSILPGSAGSLDVGSHASNYDPLANPNNTTRHTHPVSGQVTFSQANPSGLGSTIQPNAIVGTSFDYEPPTVEIAFIMYNDTI